MTKLNAWSFIQWGGALALAGFAANATAAIFELQHGALPDASYEYQHALIRNDTFLADMPQGNSSLLVGTKAETETEPGVQGELRTLLQFDLSPVVDSIGSSAILSASLQLRHLSTGGNLPRIDGTPKVNVYTYGFNVVRDFATWNDPDGDGNPATGDTTPGGTLGTFINTFGELDQANGIFEPMLPSTPEFVAAVEDALAGDQFLRFILIEDQPDVSTRDIAFFSGTTTSTPEFLPRLTIEVEGPAGVFGDYNGDGFVNAADYSTWRDNLGAFLALPNEDPSATPGEVTATDFDVWKSRFGASAGVGSGISATPVPEPPRSILVLAAATLLLLYIQRRQFNLQ